MDLTIGDTTVLFGDCLQRLKDIPDGSVNTCVTSPPYYALRDYGTASWEGGSPECSHKPPHEWIEKNFVQNSNLRGGTKTLSAAAETRWNKDGVCVTCGAVRVDSQIGLEPTPEAFVQTMIQVFREVKRILRDDGTLWLNLGDSFVGNASPGSEETRTHHGGKPNANQKITVTKGGFPPKNLLGIPWMVAFALRADGWILRSDIIWSKPNSMPESVEDRPTKAHEYIFLFAKSPRYYYDAKAIAEPVSGPFRPGGKNKGLDNPKVPDPRKKQDALGKGTYTGFNDRLKDNPTETRNKRDVWTVATEPYVEAHFATFPTKLIEPCILAGCPPGGLVLDPFMGSGTTAVVANRNGRKAIGCELNPSYVDLIKKRVSEDGFAMTEKAEEWV